MKLFQKRLTRHAFIDRNPWILLLPGLIVLAVLGVIPFGYSINLSLHNLDLSKPYLGNPFVGAANFASVFKDPRAIGAFANTLYIVGGEVLIETVLGLMVALLLHQIGKGKNIMLILIIFPMLISRVVVGLLWKILYNPLIGPINWFMNELFGVSDIAWLANPSLTKFSIIVAGVWQWTPFMVLILSAGLDMLPKDTYEAARIDGASVWKTFLYITIPLVTPVMGVAILFRGIEALRTFDLIYILTGGGPGTTSETVDIYAYLVGLSRGSRISYASALSVVLLAATILLFMILVRGLKGLRKEG